MGRVIATVAFGSDEYFMLAEMMFESLYKTGSTADRVCLSDREWAFPAHLGVRCLVSPKSVTMKASAPLKMNLSDEDYLMLVDSDIIFIKNPDYLFAGEVRVATTGIPVVGTVFDFNRVYLESWELDRIPKTRRCINTGLMVMRGDLAGDFARAWSEFHLEVRGESADEYVCLQDQPALEALLIRGALRAEMLPSYLMHFPAGTKRAPHPECVVLHFTGYPRTKGGKTRIALAMRRALEAL